MAKGARQAISYFLRKAPFAVAASSLQGAVNYAITVYLSYSASFEATGQYRLLFSFYSLVGLAAMYETNKIFIKSIVADDHESTTGLFANRLVFTVGTFLLCVLAVGIERVLGGDTIPLALLWIAAVGIVIYPLDSYLSYLQAKARFNLLFAAESVKYLGALAVFVLMIERGFAVETAMAAQLGFMALCHIAYFSLVTRVFIDFGLVRTKLLSLLRSRAAGDARTYSFANLLPASLEHVDKLLVGWVFGLEFLGVYTLAYSTGRFVYNTVKPALYIYYRRFVDRMPGWRLLRWVGGIFTLLGIVSSLIFLWAVAEIPEMERFSSGAPATVILFLAYGVGIVRAVYGQAFSLNKQSDAMHALKAAAIATMLSLVLLATALVSPMHVALILLALQYPLRDGMTVMLMARYRSKALAK